MSATILNFEADLPEVMYWDSSFIINFCVDGVKYHSACAGFAQRLKEENILSIISNLTLDEVWYALLRVNLNNDYEDNWREMLRHEPELIVKYLPILRRATADLLMLPNLILVETPTEATLKALDTIERYHLLPRDAIHLTTAISLGVHTIVTTNLDFTRVDGATIYTCNPKAFGERED
jgi:predicted nucleic acid-binding protein